MSSIEEIRNILSLYEGFTIEEIRGFSPSRFCVTVEISSFTGRDEIYSFLEMLKKVLEKRNINWGTAPEWDMELLSKTKGEKIQLMFNLPVKTRITKIKI